MNRHSNRIKAGEVGVLQVDAPARSALSRLFHEHNVSLVQLLRARLRSDQEARDVAQDAYVRLLQLEQFGTINCLRSYLFRIALNIATDRLRSAVVRNTAHRDPILEHGAYELSPDRAVLAADELQRVVAALASLPFKPRRAFVLYSFTELNVDEVAERLGVTDRMVRNYVSQARACCRAALSDVTSGA
jgi:RNA polymerase sigma factor (sigma-70 family)